jgi:transcriptional regulator with GAF, ATPase, and Fis domain
MALPSVDGRDLPVDASPNGPLADALDRLASLRLDKDTLEGLLTRVAELVSNGINGSDMGGVAITVRGVVFTGGTSDELVEEIDSYQYASGSGPCLASMQDDRVVRVASTSKEKRWMSFSASAASKGIESVLSAPLVSRGELVGSVNLYARRTDAFTQEDEASIGTLARNVSVMIANARAFNECHKTGQGLRRRLDEADLVGRAAGVIMERHQLTGREAHVSLRRDAARSGMTLAGVSRGIVEELRPSD